MMRWLLVPLGLFLFSVLALSSLLVESSTAWAGYSSSSAYPPLDVFVSQLAPSPIQSIGGNTGLGISFYHLEPDQFVADWYGLCLAPDEEPMTLRSRLQVGQVWGIDPGYLPFGVDWEPKAMTLQPGECVIGSGWYIIALLQEGPMPSWGTGWNVLVIWETSSAGN